MAFKNTFLGSGPRFTDNNNTLPSDGSGGATILYPVCLECAVLMSRAVHMMSRCV